MCRAASCPFAGKPILQIHRGFANPALAGILLQRIMSVPRPQFDQLAIEQLDALYRMARRLTRDTNQAEDLVQETFARALRSRESFNLQEFGIKPWLLRIMYNLHLNRAGREKRQPALASDESLEQSSMNSDVDLPIDPTNFQAMDEQLVHALEDLPEDYRTVMLLWAVEELSYKEIAETLEVPLGTVMSRLHRAKQRLMVQLKDYAAEQRIIPK
jgi:RNA polymerase sigma-70 factor (ECF subfamily)